jgi:hypothetical protein
VVRDNVERIVVGQDELHLIRKIASLQAIPGMFPKEALSLLWNAFAAIDEIWCPWLDLNEH